MSVLESIKNREEVFWLNPNLKEVKPDFKLNGYSFTYIKAAQNRFMRFLPYIASAFPETAAKKGVIESDLYGIPEIKEWLVGRGAKIQGNVFLKDDAHLPIAGSVKARGGIHEVLKIAETLAHKAGILQPTDNYGIIDSEKFRNFYSQYTIQVGSTGNLGLSVGKMAAKLGFHVIVHMSSDAKEWKKQMLQEAGAIVKTYDGNYSEAVKKGREESDLDSKSFFIDDENSEDLFFGYATAALRLKIQLFRGGIPVNETHPLFVYLPCGVGGAPGGITFGLKMIYGDHVHCFFAEPVESPCVTLGMATGKHADISVQDVGLSGKTIADGLAVGRPSGFVCGMMDELMSGAFTVSDEKLLEYQKQIMGLSDIKVEPSACAGLIGLEQLKGEDSDFSTYIKKHQLEDYMHQANHIIWATGGGLMPE